MRHLGLLLATITACTADDPISATFHGTVDTPITHVMAVSPSGGEIQRILVPTETRSFSVEVPLGHPWTLVLVDANKVGSAMVTGVLRADTLDSFLPSLAHDIDLGDISLDGREATMAGSSVPLDAALGLQRDTLAILGGVDDLALRYANPDVDSDGLLDLVQAHDARLELHAEYDLTMNGRAATAGDLITRSAEIRYQHAGTGIFARLPEAFGPVDRDDASVTFEQPFQGVVRGGLEISAAAGQPISDLTFGDRQTFGVFARPGHDLPRGTYRFRSGERTLDFALVHPPAATAMTASTHQVFPRLQFVPSDPSCTVGCEIAAIQWAWERSSDAGWRALSREDALVLRPSATLDLLTAGGGHRRYELPVGVPSGEVAWDLPLRRAPQDNATETTSTITFLRLAFQTRPGMTAYAWLGGDAARRSGVPEVALAQMVDTSRR